MAQNNTPANTPTVEQLIAMNQALLAKVQELEAKKSGGLRITAKVSEKGAVSLYGLGRFPVTLYAPQWTRLFTEAKPVVEACIQENKELLDAIAEDHRAAKPAAAPAAAAKTTSTGKLTFAEWKARQVADALAVRGSK